MRDWLRLVRLPNLATAAADPLAGFLVCSRLAAVGEIPAAGWAAVAAGVALYAAGMVLNDVSDLELDRLERPERPLPSGRISLGQATLAGFLLLAAGGAAACVAAVSGGTPWPALVAAGLTIAIWMYDCRAKGTAIGPAVMGSCRALNWLVGMTAAGGPTSAAEWAIPLGMGLYVAGITLFARDEAGLSRRGTLVAGGLLMVAGLTAAAAFVWLPLVDGATRVATLPAGSWLACWAILGAGVLIRAGRAVGRPEPVRVRAAVGNAIMSIITFDAVLVLAACGEGPAVAVILLLVWFLLGRRLVPPT